jgi:GntR family transcriptional regulator, rspAB operon transcriptional repressor
VGAKKTQAQRAYESIRQRIVTGELRPGEALEEQALMAATGVGRTPVRDALLWLAHEGLVEITPRRGTFVSSVQLDDVQQIFDLRVAMEGVVATAVISRVAEADLAVLDDLITTVEADDDPTSDPVVDRAFHDALLQIAGNRYLSRYYSQLVDASIRLFHLTHCEMESRAEQLATLRTAREALRTRDRAALETILTEHVRDFRRRLGGALSR